MKSWKKRYFIGLLLFVALVQLLLYFSGAKCEWEKIFFEFLVLACLGIIYTLAYQRKSPYMFTNKFELFLFVYVENLINESKIFKTLQVPVAFLPFFLIRHPVLIWLYDKKIIKCLHLYSYSQ
jgi:hypothetical protein